MHLPYALRLATQSLWKDKWINLVSMLTISAGLIILSIGYLVFYNMDVATRKMPERFSMVVYFDAGLSKERLDQALSSLKTNAAVSSLRFIPKDAALKELRSVLKDSDYVLEGLGENPLPDAAELKLKREATGPERARQLAAEIKKISGVTEVDYGEKFLTAIHDFRAGFNLVSTVLSVLIATGIVFVCYSTVKILFYRRNEEIETFKLLGATKWFIRAPFLIEGSVIGIGGGLFGLMGIMLFYFLVLLRLVDSVAILKMVLFPTGFFLLLPALGLFLGMSGAALALGRLRY